MTQTAIRFAVRCVCLLSLAGIATPVTPATDEPDVFDPGPVLRLRIELSDEAAAGLRDQTREDHKEYMRATVYEGEKKYGDVGIRLKGFLGSFRDFDQKPGLTLKFNKFVPEQRFHGLRKLILNNGVQDGTYLSEMIGNELFRAADVPAPRMGLARVQVNGRKLGLYVAAEALTSDFLNRWFKDAGGNLYEGPGDISRDTLDVDSGGGVSDRADLKALIEATREPEPAARLERMGKLLDIDRFISFLAVESFTVHWDGYMQGRNNYHVYNDSASGRLVFIPHGTDQLFQQPSAPTMLQANGIVAKAILKTKAGQQRYRERLQTLVEKVFKVDELQKRIQEIEAKVRSVLKEDGPGALLGHAVSVRALSWRIGERFRSIRDQLAGNVVAVPSAPAFPFGPDGKARLAGWQARLMAGAADFQRTQGQGESGGAALRIEAGGDCRASWRKSVHLLPGRYRLTGKMRTHGVESGGRSLLDDGSKGGADLRISGDQPRSKLVGDNDWTRFEYEFLIDGDEDLEANEATSEVVLVCELQAARGTVWFDEGSLELIRTPLSAPRRNGAEGAAKNRETGGGPAGR